MSTSEQIQRWLEPMLAEAAKRNVDVLGIYGQTKDPIVFGQLIRGALIQAGVDTDAFPERPPG